MAAQKKKQASKNELKQTVQEPGYDTTPHPLAEGADSLDLTGFTKGSDQIWKPVVDGELQGIYRGMSEVVGDEKIPGKAIAHKVETLERSGGDGLVYSFIPGTPTDADIADNGIQDGDMVYFKYLGKASIGGDKSVNRWDFRFMKRADWDARKKPV